ncbi:MAG: hypothetical protein DWQ47_06805 [Acidobacteria bacterium]|nr:MAG: hypothetical protein DWQ32_10355 [Acidobacteriota bacterium]REK15040.1 MAG: hypothetical protein DWQ43_16045 [Acidobacteriota bacterium]REK45754.1 MAG: hypothetical protein DWQ47_06805 [Acidobacteriota bacterium]
MSTWMVTAGKWGSIFVILALIITLLKQIIGFIGFLTTIIKVGIILVFVALFLGVGLLVLKSWKSSKRKED